VLKTVLFVVDGRRNEKQIVLSTVQVRSDINWKEEQFKDPELIEVLNWVINQNKPDWEKVSSLSAFFKSFWRDFELLQVKDGFVVRKFFRPYDDILQVVVPQHMTHALLNDMHNQGHWGIWRTKLAVKDRYYWPSWQQNVVKCVKECISCNRKKGPVSKRGEPLQRVEIDIFGPLVL
jgi:hypothetical protein